jgi:hypothetical protein
MFRREDDVLDFEKDYIKRQMKALSQALAKILLGARTEMKYEDAILQLKKTAGDHLRVDPELLGALDVASAVSLLRRPERVLAYAELLEAEAEVHRMRGDEQAAEARHRRAEALRAGLTPRAAPRGARSP